MGRSLTIRFPSSSSTSVPHKTRPVSTSHMRSTPSHPPPARRPYLPTPRRSAVAAAVPFSAAVVAVVAGKREPTKLFKEKGENAKEPVPDSRPGRTWSVSPDRASNSLIVESWPPLFFFAHTVSSLGTIHERRRDATHAASIIRARAPSSTGIHSSMLIRLFSLPLTTLSLCRQFSMDITEVELDRAFGPESAELGLGWGWG